MYARTLIKEIYFQLYILQIFDFQLFLLINRLNGCNDRSRWKTTTGKMARLHLKVVSKLFTMFDVPINENVNRPLFLQVVNLLAYLHEIAFFLVAFDLFKILNSKEIFSIIKMHNLRQLLVQVKQISIRIYIFFFFLIFKCIHWIEYTVVWWFSKKKDKYNFERCHQLKNC